MSSHFPDPFSDAVVEEVKALIIAGELHDLSVALDAQISSVHIPEWLQAHRISRIYGVLMELQANTQDRTIKNKITALLTHMEKKYQGRLVND